MSVRILNPTPGSIATHPIELAPIMSDPVVKPDLPLADWLDAAAAKQPTPGGGSVAAVAGALAAAMGEMTLNYSVGRKANAPEDDGKLSDLLHRLTRARSLLLRLCEEDQAAYAAWRATKDLPDDNPDRRAAVFASLDVPAAVMATAAGVLDLAVEAAPIANPWLLSDLLVCGDLATAAVRCASYNVAANLDGVEDADARRTTSHQTLERAVRQVQTLQAAVSTRQA